MVSISDIESYCIQKKRYSVCSVDQNGAKTHHLENDFAEKYVIKNAEIVEKLLITGKKNYQPEYH